MELESVPSDTTAASAVKKAKDALARGRKLLAERQKLIKIADRSDLGWAVVSEYTADELADDSDDEKRLEKAEKMAERKASRRRRWITVNGLTEGPISAPCLKPSQL